MAGHTDLLTAKEIAAALRRHPSYVYAMRRRGFPMPGKRATLTEAQSWLQKHPEPRKRGLPRSRTHTGG